MSDAALGVIAVVLVSALSVVLGKLAYALERRDQAKRDHDRWDRLREAERGRRLDRIADAYPPMNHETVDALVMRHLRGRR